MCIAVSIAPPFQPQAEPNRFILRLLLIQSVNNGLALPLQSIAACIRSLPALHMHDVMLPAKVSAGQPAPYLGFPYPEEGWRLVCPSQVMCQFFLPAQ